MLKSMDGTSRIDRLFAFAIFNLEMLEKDWG